MSKVKTGTIPLNVLSTPITYATFPIDTLKNQLLAQTNCQGIRFFPAIVNYLGDSYLSIMAMGYDTVGNNLTDRILLDTVPCPPECHITGVMGNPNNDISTISWADAQAKLDRPSFSAEFNRTEDLEPMFDLTDALKLRIFFALIPNRNVSNPQRTFVVQAANLIGDALVTAYLQDDNPGQ